MSNDSVTLLAYFSSCEYDFRVAELEAVADTLNIPLKFLSIPDMKDVRAFYVYQFLAHLIRPLSWRLWYPHMKQPDS